MFSILSTSSMVTAPASTGSDSNSRRAVMAADHMNRGIRSCFMFFGFMLIVFEMKFNAPKIDYAPARCRKKRARSTDGPACAILLAATCFGYYKVTIRKLYNRTVKKEIILHLVSRRFLGLTNFLLRRASRK